jgi:hypothetical protein
MKTRNRQTKLRATALAIGLLAAIFVAWGARPAQAIIINGKTGLFGVAEGQTVRVSIVNLAQTKGGVVPCIGIFDLNGTEIARQESTRSLMMGQGMFFDFDAASFGLRGGERAQIRVEVKLEQPPDPTRTQPPDPTRPEDVMVTVEVFDTDTGKTMFIVPSTLKGFNPQPEPPAPAPAQQ